MEDNELRFVLSVYHTTPIGGWKRIDTHEFTAGDEATITQESEDMTLFAIRVLDDYQGGEFYD